MRYQVCFVDATGRNADQAHGAARDVDRIGEQLVDQNAKAECADREIVPPSAARPAAEQKTAEHCEQHAIKPRENRRIALLCQ